MNMSVCKLMDQCVFFNDKMTDMPSTAEFFKTKYCRAGDNSSCARYLVFDKLGLEQVPHDLLPCQVDRIEEILDET